MKESKDFLEVVGWVIIAGGIVLLASIVCFIIEAIMPGQTGAFISIGGRVTGLILGIAYATDIWNKYGTMAWLSKFRKKL
jgi:hypothetical protein